MKRMRPIGGVMVASALACGGAGTGTTAGSSSGAASTGDSTSTPGDTVDPTGGAATTAGPATTQAATSDDSTATAATSSTTTDASVSSSTGGANGSRCEGSALALCEDFEDAADGGFPVGWGARGDEWGEGVIGVASDDARLGAKALKVDGGDNGQHFMDLSLIHI